MAQVLPSLLRTVRGSGASLREPTEGEVRGRAQIARRLGDEFLEAERELTERAPYFSNLRLLVGHVLPSFSNTGTLPAAYEPKSGRTFALRTLLIPIEDLSLTAESGALPPDAADQLFVERAGERFVRFFIHPDSASSYQHLAERYEEDPVCWVATPTSSARSLLVTDAAGVAEPFIIKTSLFRRMRGFSRSIDRERVVRSVAMSQVLSGINTDTGGKIPGTNMTWALMPEYFAALPPGAIDGAGFIYRDAAELMNDTEVILPWLALIARRKDGPRWIDALFEHSDRDSMATFLWEDLLKPATELQALLTFCNGITPELHQQNLMIRVDRETRRVRGLVLRDMDSNWVNHSLRVNLLKKPEVRASESFVEDAKLFCFGRAQGSMFDSYVGQLRKKCGKVLVRYSVPRRERAGLLDRMDQVLIDRFNETFPSWPAGSLPDLRDQLSRLHRTITTPEELSAYLSLEDSREQPR